MNATEQTGNGTAVMAAEATMEAASLSFVVRLSGLPTSAVQSLTTGALRSELARLHACNNAVLRLTSRASDVLFAAIGRQSDPARRSVLLRVRRGLYNGRVPREADRHSILSCVAHTEACDVVAAADAILDRTRITGTLAEHYEAAVGEARASVREMLNARNFSDGVLLSSPSLYRNFARYAIASARSPTARDLQIERGILRYLTRASMKATPFGSFCAVLTGQVCEGREDEQPQKLFRVVGSLTPRHNIVGLNKRLYAMLWAHLKTRRPVRDALVVDVNPTLERDATALVFLAALDGREVFQRLNSSEALTVVLATVGATNGSRCDVLRDALIANPRVDTSAGEAQEYIDALIAIGLLRIRTLVSPHASDWATPLIRALDGIRDEDADEIAHFLVDAEASARSYATADSCARLALSESLAISTDNLAHRLSLPALSLNRLAVFEDCGALAELHLVRSTSLDSAIDALRHFIEKRIPFSGQRWAMATMRHFFDSHYGASREAVPLLTFYEDYFREHFKQHLDNERRIKAGERDGALAHYVTYNPFNLEILEVFRRMSSTWHDVILGAWRQSPLTEELSFDPSQFGDLSRAAPINPDVPRSVSMFCQVFEDPGNAGRVRLVLKRGLTYSGFGKFFSRFLQLFPSSVVDRLTRTVDRPSGPMLAEIGGETDHNANLHPPLLPFYLEYPTGDRSNGDQRTLSCTDIQVERDTIDKFALCLRHTPTARRVYTMDVGFQNVQGRPALYQLLAQFAPPSGIGIRLPESLSRDANATDDAHAEIEYRPRLVYDTAIVLARRRWSVPRSRFPRRETAESSYDYFVRVNAWRNDAGIPAQVYVRITPEQAKRVVNSPVVPPQNDSVLDGLGEGQPDHDTHDAFVAEGAHDAGESPRDVPLVATKGGAILARRKAQRTSRDYAKPQFIDFESPLLADLFGRLPAALDGFTAEIEEQYPGPAESPQVAAVHHASEFVLQLDWDRK
jgi:hypothetical protein